LAKAADAVDPLPKGEGKGWFLQPSPREVALVGRFVIQRGFWVRGKAHGEDSPDRVYLLKSPTRNAPSLSAKCGLCAVGEKLSGGIGKGGEIGMDTTQRRPPIQWQFRKFADVGTSEEFIRQFLELRQILQGTLIVEPEERERVNVALGDVLSEGVTPAFLELRKIRESVGKELPMLDQLQMYEDFARKLWKAYKELMQTAAEKMGFKIGFLFQDDAKFEAGLKKFRELNPEAPPAFEDFVRENRRRWQNELADFRNNIVEHPSAERGAYAKFYRPSNVEILFDNVWRTIVDILSMLLFLHLPKQFAVEDLGSNDPQREWPNRFRFYLVGVEPPDSAS
jgi:hypothetical protein